MNGTIYILTFANGKQYVGQTIRTMSERMSGHRYLIKSITGQAIAKYGEPKVGILRSGVDNQADLDRMEVEAIIEHLSLHPNGYNLESGGRGKGQVSDLTRTRMSASAKGNGCTQWIVFYSKFNVSAVRYSKIGSKKMQKSSLRSTNVNQ